MRAPTIVATVAFWSLVTSASPALAEGLGSYASHAASGRAVVIRSTTGHELRVTPYGDHMVRVQAIRPGASFASDDGIGIVESHDWPGALAIEDTADTLWLRAADAAGVRVRVQKRPLLVEVLRGDETTPVLRDGDGVDFGAAGITQRFAPNAGERFLGLGHSYFGRVERLELTGGTHLRRYGTAQFEQAPLIVPFYLSSRGYGLLVPELRDVTFHFEPGRYGFDGESLDYFVILGPALRTVLDRYTQLTGRPRLPRLAMFGLALSDKGAPAESSAAWWQETVHAHRAAGYPIDHLVHDNRWRAGGGERCMSRFAWDPVRYPDPAAFEAWSRAAGVVSTLDFNRCIANQSDGWRPELNIATITGVDFADSAPDLTRADTRSWWWNLMFEQTLDPSLGYPGSALWIDEFDEMGAAPDTLVLGDGRTWGDVRNGWFLLIGEALVESGWDRGVGEGERPFVWVRGMSAGGQRWATMWSGDIEPTFDEMRRQIRGMLSAGISGVPFWGHDAGGFFADRVSADEYDGLYQSWAMAQGSFSPYWKPHGQGHSRWPIDRSDLSQLVARRYAELRYRSIPYLYSLAHAAHDTGLPIARPMPLDHPDEDDAWEADLQYLWGDAFLVAPSPSALEAVVDVWLPSGTWLDLWTGEPHTGGRHVSMLAPPGRMPVLVRAGAVVPMAPYAESTAFLRRDVLEVHVWAGADGAFDLVEDDGITERFDTAGEQRTTTLEWRDDARELVVRPSAGEYASAPDERDLTLVAHGLESPLCASVDGLALASSWRPGVLAATLTVSAGRRAVGGGVTIALRECAAVAPVRYEAEAGTTDATVAAKDGASGGRYVGGLDAVGRSLEIDLEAPAAADYALTIGYANGRTEPASRRVSVGGESQEAFFDALGDWSTFSITEPLVVSLAAGRSTLRIETESSSAGVVDIDFVDLSALSSREPFVLADDLLVAEAEHFHRSVSESAHTWQRITYPHDYAGAGAVIATPDRGANVDTNPTGNSPRLDYTVELDPGTYFVWVRGHAFGDGDRDSVHVGLDGESPASADRIAFTDANDWLWTSDTMDAERATIDVSTAGVHTLHLWMREDGAIVDRLVLARAAAFVPSGEGPAETIARPAPVDADAGPPGADAGRSDAGGVDAGAARDAGAMDARADRDAAMPTGGSSSGCGCSVPGDDRTPLGTICFATLAIAVCAWRRRLRR